MKGGYEGDVRAKAAIRHIADVTQLVGAVMCMVTVVLSVLVVPDNPNWQIHQLLLSLIMSVQSIAFRLRA
jgi:hypothetical protein